MSDKKQNEPYIILSGEIRKPTQLMLVIDSQIICDIQKDDVALALMSAYFVFNICYVPGCNNVFKFLESTLLNIRTKLPPSINHFRASLSSLDIC